MKWIAILFILNIIMYPAGAQVYEIGHITRTFNDPLRSGGFGSNGGPGRQVQCEIYYPALASGEQAAFASGLFPAIVFGHGYLMPWDAYRNIWESLVSQGYILVFPRTETGIRPIHSEFAADISLCAKKMLEAGQEDSGFFNGKVSARIALMGHSMGGGSAFLAASETDFITTVVGLAPLETTPPASTAAAAIGQPSLILSGSGDEVTVPAIHHRPIFDNLGSSCKYFISITGGAHCYFANPNMGCDIGEMLVSSGITITRSDQQAVMNDYLVKWLDYYLKDADQARKDFIDLLHTDYRITFQEHSALSVYQQAGQGLSTVNVYPNPARDILIVQNLSPGKMLSYRLADITGRIILNGILAAEGNSIDIHYFTEGIYLLSINNGVEEFHFRVIVGDSY